MITREQALAYHAKGRPGKLKISSTKPTRTQEDLSLAYSPGVAEPCREIARDPDDVFKYTARGNLVAVVSNGTAVLGLGNLGPVAAKPVMEGKAVLFKRFADIDVFDIEIASEDVDEIVRCVELIAPTFGGINLEDIRAPECFEIEARLKESLDIPVFHDDQHGTAIISGAALLNATQLTGRSLDEIKVVFNGAGASGIACAKLYRDLGVPVENITLCDSRGVIHVGRTDGMNRYKAELARETDARTLTDALRGADVFVGLSQAGVVTPEMVTNMADQPIIFAMANPDPEIAPEAVRRVRPDAIIATGRSDYPNQVNNVLGFPFIFRGALDVRARQINEPMKHAAVNALAELALRGEAVPKVVRDAYPDDVFDFGPSYIIPKPFDPRMLIYVPLAVAQAAMESGVARRKVDLVAYRQRLEETIGHLAEA
ncbi:MAG TPA: malic enzyme-like NAD(P)-binding protein [Myxococcota bacterium]|nr:malic enzyme-like NAD(P)-binding protein [Myxococcota bacterium]